MADLLVVVGGGPAGLAVALRAADLGRRVLLLESGDGHHDLSDLDAGAVGTVDDVEGVHRGMVGSPSPWRRDHLARANLRAPGGNARRWMVRPHVHAPPHVRIARPLPDDLSSRAADDVPPWPGHDELGPWLDEAEGFLGLGSPQYDATAARCALPLDRGVLRPRYFHFVEARFVWEGLWRAALDHEGIEVRAGVTVSGIDVDGPRGRVRALRAMDVDGRTHRIVVPNEVVLAMGASNTARLLLSGVADGEVPDPHGLLGRWFMDHPHGDLGLLVPSDDPSSFAPFHDFHERDGQLVLGHHALVPDAAREHGLSPFALMLVGAPPALRSRSGAGTHRLLDQHAPRTTLRQRALLLAGAATGPRDAVAVARHVRGRSPRHSGALGGGARR